MRLFVHEGDFDLELPIDQLRELESVRMSQLRAQGIDPRHAGVEAIYDRLTTGGWLIEDATHAVRLGLIGRGMDGQSAHDLVQRALTGGKGVLTVVKIASAVLHASLHGPIGDDGGAGDDSAQGESVGEAATPAVSPTDASDGAGGSDRAPSSDSTPAPSDA